MKNIRGPLLLVFHGFGALATCADELAMPNPILTPGAVDLTASVAIVCNRSTRERRLFTDDRARR